MGALPATKLSVEEYLALERTAEVHSEYIDGEMFPLAAASLAHSIINGKIFSILTQRLAKTSCLLAAAMRVRVGPRKYLIPDSVVICGEPILTDESDESLTNPKVIIEILSPSTADYDRGTKFDLYRKLQSFEEYLLVSQDQARVDVAHKRTDKRWVLSTSEGLDATVQVESLGVSLPMTEIYESIQFKPVVP